MTYTVNALYENAGELLAAAIQKDVTPNQPPVDVDAIAQLLEIKVRYDASLEARDIIGKIEFEGSQCVISINPHQNRYEPRRRFTLAHELGHYCLHTHASKQEFTDSRRTMSRTATFWDEKEREANQFAAELLMPDFMIFSMANQVLDEHDDQHPDTLMSASVFTTRMADIFVTSNEAMTYRLHSLGILKK